MFNSIKKLAKLSSLTLILRILAVLFLFSLSRLHFYFSNLAFFDNIGFHEFKRIFQGGIRFDTVSVLYLNLPFVLIYIFPGNHLQGKKFIVFTDVLFFITNAIGLLANCIDGVYYQFNLRRSIFSSLVELQDINNLSSLLLSFFIRYWSVWVVWVFFLVSIWLIIKYIKPSRTFKNKHTQFDFAIISVFFIVAGLRGGDLYHSTRPLGLNHAGEYVEQPHHTALVFNTPFTIFKTLGGSKIKKLTFFQNDIELEKAFNPIHLADSSNTFRPYNVVIIIIESYSEEASGVVNKDKTTGGFTPFLDSLRQKSFYSEYSFANGKKSIEALPAIWCSLPSFKQPFVLSPFSTNKLNSLPSILKTKGYHTSFFHGAPNGSMGFQSFANLAGIDHYFGKTEYANEADSDGIWGIWDEPFLQFFGKKLDQFHQPFFSTVFTLSSHDPFKIPSHLKGKFKKGPHPIYETLSYTDFALKRFFESIKNKPWFRNTVFVITADHTSSHATLPAFSNNLGRFRVPIFFYFPEKIEPTKTAKMIQQIDIFPSLMALLKFEKPFLAFGKNVFSNQYKDYAINYFENYQWHSGKYVMLFDGEKPQGLFNFANEALLKNNLSKKEPQKLVEMQLQAKGFLQQYQNRLIENRLTVE
ncbi:alkaline phosphatase family protein [Lacihabitans sp. CCS-44]|uniref:LTA synthase family protein n=1 Tax=Lacihabitans sp. CCS-44 TaxID=2487331 RepID=UPI0020CD3D68|nr:alkaline phosphatase family protein [Lacihabitans sp. CCS-44]MCP9755343.1 alkaline phosphatase family protein [Lacihabitans sp. CCS-44]